MVFNSLAFIGLDFTTRDQLHDAWSRSGHLRRNMALLIAAGSLLTWSLNRQAGPVALASLAAFTVAAVADAVTYQALGTRSHFARVNGSNLAGSLADSLIFSTLATGQFMPAIVLAQAAAKTAGGLLWFYVLTRDVVPAPQQRS